MAVIGKSCVVFDNLNSLDSYNGEPFSPSQLTNGQGAVNATQGAGNKLLPAL